MNVGNQCLGCLVDYIHNYVCTHICKCIYIVCIYISKLKSTLRNLYRSLRRCICVWHVLSQPDGSVVQGGGGGGWGTLAVSRLAATQTSLWRPVRIIMSLLVELHNAEHDTYSTCTWPGREKRKMGRATWRQEDGMRYREA
jgi:hypothetical protein